MLVKATKTMVNEIKKAIKDDSTFKDYSITLEKFSDRQFRWYVDIDGYKHETDYNYKDNTFNVIKIEYPYNYYACNKYITTRDLVKIFRSSDKTLNGFINSFKEYIEI